jgi:riboflavin transporter FmnP
MKTKTIAIIAIFTALSVGLVLSPFKFTFPLLPFLKYQIWEIPLVAAFLLYGPLVGIAAVLINTVILLVVYPGDLPTGPLYNLAAVVSMLLGIYIIHRFAGKYFSRGRETILTGFSTVLGSIARVGLMSIVNWIFLRYPYPIGYSMPEAAIIPMIPIVGFFNLTLALYTIPIGYVVARAVSLGINTPRWSQQ